MHTAYGFSAPQSVNSPFIDLAFPTRYRPPPRRLQSSVDRVKMWRLEDHKDRQYGGKDDRNSWKKMWGGVGEGFELLGFPYDSWRKKN